MTQAVSQALAQAIVQTFDQLETVALDDPLHGCLRIKQRWAGWGHAKGHVASVKFGYSGPVVRFFRSMGATAQKR
jgi:hypothetical protein